jgi:hypothetical protein
VPPTELDTPPLQIASRLHAAGGPMMEGAKPPTRVHKSIATYDQSTIPPESDSCTSCSSAAGPPLAPRRHQSGQLAPPRSLTARRPHTAHCTTPCSYNMLYHGACQATRRRTEQHRAQHDEDSRLTTLLYRMMLPRGYAVMVTAAAVHAVTLLHRKLWNLQLTTCCVSASWLTTPCRRFESIERYQSV